MISKSRAAFTVLVWVFLSVTVVSVVNEYHWSADVARIRAEAETKACLRLRRSQAYPLRTHTAYVPDGTVWRCSDLGEPLCGYVLMHDPLGK